MTAPGDVSGAKEGAFSSLAPPIDTDGAIIDGTVADSTLILKGSNFGPGLGTWTIAIISHLDDGSGVKTCASPTWVSPSEVHCTYPEADEDYETSRKTRTIFLK